jgi:hypothetical protein
MSRNIRAVRINEDYYARRNTPTFNQLAGGKHHFTDALGREYTLASQNSQVFQNKRLQFEQQPRKQKIVHALEPVTSRPFGFVKLYVRLTNHTKWFGTKDTRKTLTLTSRAYGDFTVQLKQTDKPDPRRATGSIFVKGLDLMFCRRLLNSSDDDDEEEEED